MIRAHRALASRRAGPRVRETVLLLGVCSLLTDISSEMVATILPLYLVSTLGFTRTLPLGEATWTVPADGSGSPRRWLPGADSAAVVRG